VTTELKTAVVINEAVWVLEAAKIIGLAFFVAQPIKSRHKERLT
jgi:hypothetical protein